MQLRPEQLLAKPYYATRLSAATSTFKCCIYKEKSRIKWLSRGRQSPHQFLFFRQQSSQFRRSRIRFDAPLYIGQFSLRLPVLQLFDTAHRLFPCQLTRLFKKDFEKCAPVAFFQFRREFRGHDWLVRKICGDQRSKNILGLKSQIKALIVQLLRQLVSKHVSFREHANQSAFDRFGGTSYQFGLHLQSAAALRRRFTKRSPQHRLLEPKLMRDSRGPFRA